MSISKIKIPPLVTVALLGTAMWAVSHFLPAGEVAVPAGRLLAAGLALTGFAVAMIGVASFRRAKTTVNPLQPSAASALVIAGIYRFTRNPMYLGMLLILLGWAVFLSNAFALIFPVGYIPLMNRLQIIPEERALVAVFGTEYSRYLSRVRRWL